MATAATALAVADRQIEVELPPRHPGQTTVWNGLARFTILCCGRRWGKTLFGVCVALVVTLRKANARVWWVAPTYPLAQIGWDALKGLVAPMENAGRCVIRESERKVTFANGSIVQVKSASGPSGLRGAGLDYVVMDEAAFIEEKAWTYQLRPALGDRRGGALIISTPAGMESWFYKLWAKGQDLTQDRFRSFQFPTWTNPYIADEEIEEFREQMHEDAFNQEIGAQFLESEAGVFRNLDLVFSKDLRLRLAHPGHRHVIGWDVAKFRDYTALCVIDVRDRTVVHFERMKGVGYAEQLERVIKLARAYPGTVWIDATGPGVPVYDFLAARGVDVEPFKFTEESKRRLVENGALACERANVHVPLVKETAILRAEMGHYRYFIQKHGGVKYGAPEGLHDDAATSFLLALWGLTAPTTKVLVAPPEMGLTYFGGSVTRRL